jgi:cell wall-associated NlpC family hydrolase
VSATLRWQRLLALSAILLLALSMVLMSASTADASTPRTKKVLGAASIAVNQIGDPYRYGAAGPNAFDCSGLTSYAYHQANLSLPRTSNAQYSYVRHIKKSNLRRGDLVFFRSGGSVYHVAMFLKRQNGQRIIVHASRSGTPVQRSAIWTSAWSAGTVRGR